jgi:hypothetical protein
MTRQYGESLHGLGGNQTRVEKFEIGIDIDSSISDWFKDMLTASVESSVTNWGIINNDSSGNSEMASNRDY